MKRPTYWLNQAKYFDSRRYLSIRMNSLTNNIIITNNSYSINLVFPWSCLVIYSLIGAQYLSPCWLYSCSSSQPGATKAFRQALDIGGTRLWLSLLIEPVCPL
jgi:hypothetical protein